MVGKDGIPSMVLTAPMVWDVRHEQFLWWVASSVRWKSCPQAIYPCKQFIPPVARELVNTNPNQSPKFENSNECCFLWHVSEKETHKPAIPYWQIVYPCSAIRAQEEVSLYGITVCSVPHSLYCKDKRNTISRCLHHIIWHYQMIRLVALPYVLLLQSMIARSMQANKE